MFSEYYPLSCTGNVVGQSHNMTLYDVLQYGYDLRLTDYPIWDESKRTWLNDAIIEHFLFREIGPDTPALFIFFINRLMNERMPAINPVFKALENVSFDDIWQTTKTVEKTNGESSAETTQESTAYSSTNPRQTMVGKDSTEYYDSGTKSTGGGTNTGTSSADTDRRVYTGRISDATRAWYSSVNNALLLVFRELEPCFSHVYDSHSNVFF